MDIICALCGTPLTSMDTLLGENKLSDGSILCNKCFNKATNINKDLVNSIGSFNLAEVRGIILGGKIDDFEENIATPILETPKMETPVNTFFDPNSFQDYDQPTRLDDIKDQIVALNAKLSIFVDSEVKELVNILDNGEKIVAIAEGKYLGNNREGIVFSTQKRVVFIDKKFFGGVVENEFMHDKISSVEYDSGILTSSMKIHTQGATAEFKLYNKSAAKAFYDGIRDYIGRSGTVQQQSFKQESFHISINDHSFSSNNQSSPFDIFKQVISKPEQTTEKVSEDVKKEPAEAIFEQLEKLGKLREMGVLTEAEFAEQKKKLLERL